MGVTERSALPRRQVGREVAARFSSHLRQFPSVVVIELLENLCGVRKPSLLELTQFDLTAQYGNQRETATEAGTHHAVVVFVYFLEELLDALLLVARWVTMDLLITVATSDIAGTNSHGLQ